MKPQAEPRTTFFDAQPPRSPFSDALRGDPLARAFRIRDAAWLSVLRALPLAPEDWVLDVGGADGVIADRVHALRGTRGVCVDVAMRGLAQARERGVEVRPVAADGRHLPFPSGTFAATLSFETLEHVVPWADVVAELVRVTKPGGAIVTSAVSARWKGTWNWCLDRLGVDIHSYADHDPIRFVDQDDLRAAFAANGAEVRAVHELNAFATLAYDQGVMLAAVLADRAPAGVGNAFLTAATATRRFVGPPLVLSELPWRLLSRSNSILVVARKR